MDIEQKKKRFLDILLTLYEVEEIEVIHVGEGVLLENELGGRDFWNVVCPSLKKQGVLKEFNDPDGPTLTEFFVHYTQHPWYRSLSDRQMQLQNAISQTRTSYDEMIDPLNLTLRTPYEQKIVEEIKRLDTEMDIVRAKLRAGYKHRFVIDSEKFINQKSTPQHIVIDDTPEDSSWRSLELRFLDGRTLHASIPSKRWGKNGISCSDLGLEKKSGDRPKEQWRILEEASQNNGQIRLRSSKTKQDSKKKQFDFLRNLLKDVFPKLKGSPFESMGDGVYQTVFEIFPEQREDRTLRE